MEKISLMVLKSYSGLSDYHLMEHLEVNVHFQLFCVFLITPSRPITNYKIVGAIRQGLAGSLMLTPFRLYLPNIGVPIWIICMNV